MPDIYISYSRQDAEEVQLLTESGLETPDFQKLIKEVAREPMSTPQIVESY